MIHLFSAPGNSWGRWAVHGIALALLGGTLVAADFPRQGLVSQDPAADLLNGFVTGNGTLGAIVQGVPVREVIIGNDSRLWLPLDPEGQDPADTAVFEGKPPGGDLIARPFLPDIAGVLPQVRALIRKEGSPKGYGPAQQLVLAEAKKQGYLGYQCPGNYHAGFRLELTMPGQGKVQDYQRTTDFTTGEVSTVWRDDQGPVSRQVFASRPAEALVLRIAGTGAGRKVGATFQIGRFPDIRLARQATAARVTGAEGWLTQVVHYQRGFLERKGGYASVLRIIPRQGQVLVEGDALTVRDAEEILVLAQIQPFATGTADPAAQPRDHLAGLLPDYPGLLAAHAAVHGALFARNRLDVGGAADAGLPVPAILARDKAAGRFSPILLEKLYDVCRYTAISSSGVLPPGGKGLWIASWKDRWNTNYTMDANLQLETASLLSSNLPELMAPLADFLLNDRVMADYRDNARKIFGCRGIQVPQTRWVDRGVNVAWGGNSSGQYWTAGAAWFASILHDYYLYTGDTDFLRRRLVPYMKEVAVFYADFLQPDGTGTLRFSPGWSPENGLLAGAGDNPTMDIAAAKELLTNLIAACTRLGIDADRIPAWRQLRDRLPPYVINADGALAEWAFAGSQDNYAHRHASHLYPLWRSREITPADSALFRAAAVATDRRIAAGGEDGSTHGHMILALTQVMLRRGDGAYGQLAHLLTGQYFYDNLMTSHFAGRKTPWIDGTGAWNEVINGMLVASEVGSLELLPALPPAMPRGTVTGMLARGQVAIERLSWDVPAGRLSVTVRSAIDQTVRIGLPAAWASVAVLADGAAVPLTGNRGVIACTANHPRTVTATWTNPP